MTNKYNAARRHHIPKMKFKVTNWAKYEAGLRQRGSLILWVTDETMSNGQAEPRLTPFSQARYSDSAIETGLMLRLVYHLPLRQTEGFMRSIVKLLDLPVEVPDLTTFSRCRYDAVSRSPRPLARELLYLLIDRTGLKAYGAGEWLQEKHSARARGSWRKLHLGVDANSGMIVASTLTEQDKDDPSQVGPLLDQIPGEIEEVTAEGAYDGAPTYRIVETRSKDTTVVIPSPVTTVLSNAAEQDPSQRDAHIASLSENRRLGW